MLRSLDDPTVALLRERLGRETDSRVRKEIATGLALAALDGSDTAARLGVKRTTLVGKIRKSGLSRESARGAV
jgi:DNA-binding NtrC family response regulator